MFHLLLFGYVAVCGAVSGLHTFYYSSSVTEWNQSWLDSPQLPKSVLHVISLPPSMSSVSGFNVGADRYSQTVQTAALTRTGCRISGSPGSNASTLRLRRLISMRPMCTMLNRAVMITRHTPSSTPIRTLTGNSRYVNRNRLPL